MKIYHFWVFLLLMPLAAENALQPYHWKNRILILDIAENREASLPKVRAALSLQHDEVLDRDLIIIDLSQPSTGLPHTITPAPKDLTALRSRFQTGASGKNTFILIGKDGGEKARQTGALQLKKFFALIDTMPMRKREQRTR